MLSTVLVYVCLQIPSIAHSTGIPEADEYPALQSFPLNHPGEYVFHFRQAEKGEMTLLLEVEGPLRGERERDELAHLGLTIEVTLINSERHVVCRAVGSPMDNMSPDNWVVSAGHGKAAFWHYGCREIKLKRSQYTLTVRLRDVDPKTPDIKVTPTFERSDNFLP